MKKASLYLLALLAMLFAVSVLYFQFSDCGISPFGCGDYSTKGTPETQKIQVGSGPEDLALDTSMGYPRIIVSCSERRKDQPQTGGFYGINPADNSTFEFTIIPTDLTLRPHGIDVVTIDSVPYLYAISHVKEGETWEHPVIRFVIQRDTLFADMDNIMADELMNVPNDLDVLEDGSFYASNYVPNMNPSESTKAILGVKNGSVVHYDGRGNWQIVLDKMCYPNGVWVNPKENYLVVANGGCKEVVRYEIKNGKVDPTTKLSTKKHGIDIPIGDNLLMDNEGVLWTVSHPCPLKFLAHAGDTEEKSPMQVFGIDPGTLKMNAPFQNNGELISAASTVLHYENRLYISQVFDPFVLVVDGF